MFTVTAKGSNRLDIDITGKIESADMKPALDKLIIDSTGFTQGRMLYRITDFKFPALGALAIEFMRLPDLLNLITRFEKIAVVADKQWVKKVSELEGALIPGMTIKAFDQGEDETAEAWLAK